MKTLKIVYLEKAGKGRKERISKTETWVQRKVRALHPKPRECSGKMAKR